MENKNETLEITNNELEYGNLIDLRSSLQVELNDILDELSSIEEDREKLQNNQYLEVFLYPPQLKKVHLKYHLTQLEEYFLDLSNCHILIHY